VGVLKTRYSYSTYYTTENTVLILHLLTHSTYSYTPSYYPKALKEEMNLILYSYCTHTLLILYSYSTHTLLILYSYSTHTLLIL
jgi:hypothetical protein